MIAFQNCALFDGVKDSLQEKTTVIVDAKKIVDVFPTGTKRVENVEVVDLSGFTLSPGFFDCHLHLNLEEITPKELQMKDQANAAGGMLLDNYNAYVALRSVDAANKTLMAGFTTVFDGGGTCWIDVALKDAIQHDRVPGPNYYICGKVIGAWDSLLFRGIEDATNGPWDMRRSVRQHLYYAVDHIKLEMSPPIRSVGRTLAKPVFTIEEILAATEESHGAGLTVSAHTRSAKATSDSLKGGVDAIIHGGGIDDEGIELMLRDNKYMYPTLASAYHTANANLRSVKAQPVLDLFEETGRIQWETLRRAYKAGVKMVLSTDTGCVGLDHGDNAEEFMRMQELGMSNAECLRAGTSEAAKAMSLDDMVGTIKPGMIADMVVLADNPFEKLETVKDVKMVIKGGKIVKDTRKSPVYQNI